MRTGGSTNLASFLGLADHDLETAHSLRHANADRDQTLEKGKQGTHLETETTRLL
jgi:hypothetical protein